MTDLNLKLQQKYDLLTQVLALTKQQTEFIEADDTDSLLTNIGQRQVFIDQLDAIHADIPDKAVLQNDPASLRLISEVTNLLNAIQEQDTSNEQAALRRMEALREQLKKTQQGRKTFGAYEASSINEVGGLYINSSK